MSSSNSPAFLSLLEEETGYLQTTSSKVRRVKIPKGHSWLLRFLPVELGPRKSFFVRTSNHWLNRFPTTCPRHTSPDFGGDPNASCPLCDTAEKLNAHGSERISYIGYKAKAVNQWIFYCLVLECDDGENSEPVKGSELYNAYEFALTKPSFEDLMVIFKKGLRKSDQSFLGLRDGRDIWVTHKKTGLRFQLEDPCPIVDGDDDKFQAAINKIWSTVRPPVIKIPSLRELQDAADKLEDQAYDERATDDASPRRHSRGDSEVEDFGRRRSRTDEDAPRRRASEDDDDEPASRRRHTEEDDEDEAPRRREARGDDQAPRRSRAEASDDAPPARRREPAPEVDEGEEDFAPRRRREEPEAAPAPPKTATMAPPPAARTMPPSARSAPASRAPLPPPPAPPTVSVGRRVESSIDEDEAIPEEANDPAPPTPLPEEAVADAPPNVTATGATPMAPRLSQRLRAGIQQLDKR